jgi:outer membrane biosynthesis protein TonB
MKRKISLLGCLLLLCGIMRSQSRSALEDEGYDYINNAQYAEAYEIFDKLHSKYPKELDYQFKLGICALNFPEKKERAIQIFQEMKVKYNTPETELYLGKAYHRNYRFDEAIVILQPLLEKLGASQKKTDKDLIPDVQLTLKHSLNGKIAMQEKVVAEVQNIGPPLNTHEDEAVPVISADESTMIYSYVGRKSIGGKLNAEMKSDPKGQYRLDIYKSTKDATGTWQPGVPIDALNTKGEDAVIALSPDGTKLFTFFSSNENEGDIMMSVLNGTSFSTPVALNKNVNSAEFWEGSCSITADGKQLYFSSERPGGLGGRDIYVSELVNGDWGPAVNLGPSVNTEYHDDAPFIHPDGVTLFFSTNGHTSIGGYDIVFTTKGSDGEWGPVQSMGIPVNTTEEDRYYVINPKGDRGYFSSTRTGAGGLGGQDIYMVTPGILGQKPIVAMIKGTIYGDDKAMEGHVVITAKATGEAIATYTSNGSTGKYLASLTPGRVYHLAVSADGFQGVEEDIDLQNLDNYLEQNKDFFLYSQAFAGVQKATVTKEVKEEVAKVDPKEEVKEAEEKTEEKTEEVPVVVVKEKEKEKEKEIKPDETEKKEEVAAVVPPKKEKKEPEPEDEPVVTRYKEKVGPCSNVLPDLTAVKGQSLNDPNIYKTLLELAGNYCADKLVFTVQIGAYRHPENFKAKKVKHLGAVESKDYPDGVARFTQNEFKTLHNAEKMRQKAIKKGIKDAWIVAFMDGQRYTLEDFIMLDFMGKAIN